MSKIKFEEALGRLEEIINHLENKELSLDESLKLFQEGIELYRYCNQRLDEVEHKITMIIEENNQIKQVPFEDEEA